MCPVLKYIAPHCRASLATDEQPSSTYRFIVLDGCRILREIRWDIDERAVES